MSEHYGQDCISQSAYTEPVTFAQRVIALREEKGWSQAELARQADLNGQTVHNIEHGRNQGGRVSRTKLAKAFGMSVAELEGTVTTHNHEGDPLQAPASTFEGQRALLRHLAAAIVAVLARADVGQQAPIPRKKETRRRKRTGTDR